MKKNVYIAFALLGAIWGSNFIFMKWAAQDISPSQIALLRILFGFLPILTFALAKRAPHWKHDPRGRVQHTLKVRSVQRTDCLIGQDARLL
jgi:drug/metabolite transporter (DMT)-like permease